MRCSVSFLTTIVLSIAVGLVALSIIWITDSEEECPKEFQCEVNGKCLKPTQICNKVNDCPDGTDELPILCVDLTTTDRVLDLMLGKCANDNDNDNTSDVSLSPPSEIERKPEVCGFLYYNNNKSTEARGIKCSRTQWSHVPWAEFDVNAITISIDDNSLNQTFMGRSERRVGNKNGSFSSFPYLKQFYIDDNYIERVGPHAFCSVASACWFTMRRNKIRELSYASFCHMPRLTRLTMSKNRLHLRGYEFKDMPHLAILDLDNNEIETVSNTLFTNLGELEMLNLSHNKLKSIGEEAFRNNLKLIELDLTGNKLLHIAPTTFTGITNFTKLYIGHNPLQKLSAEFFESMPALRSLNIEGIDISRIDLEALKYTPYLDWLHLSKFSECHLVPWVRRCFPYSDGISTTSNLLIGKSSMIVWLVGLVTLLGNISVLANRWHCQRGTRQEIQKILNIFLNNLAAADLLMGVYLLILAMKDMQFRGMYNVKAYAWGTSWLCSFIGIVAMISSEVSLLILTIMSFERCFTISYGIAVRLNLNAKLARGCMLIIWMFVCILALAPAIQWRGNSAFYGSTGLCFPLHLEDRFPVGWQYTSFVFIVVNSCCLLVITVSYSLLYFTVRKTQQKTTLTPVYVTNKKFASRFFLMVFTDVLCWAPIIILKAAVLYGYVLPKEIIGWTVIYILPLNSAVNPILYTFSTDEARNTIAVNFDRILQAMGVNYRFISGNPDTNVELKSVENGCAGCAANNQQQTATDDTELTHSSCPMMSENNCKVNNIGEENYPNKQKVKKGKAHISTCPFGSANSKQPNFLTPHTPQQQHPRHNNGIAVICPSEN
ncbi:unnamed protein product [Orchesella dallaii]|uniref:G-protein coupled receptors family 1 profile domain-containing protein n=1 Tax=Orchesella dallaii TaxID=48710 RepID=A0ABP1RDD8_9HEXA